MPKKIKYTKTVDNSVYCTEYLKYEESILKPADKQCSKRCDKSYSLLYQSGLEFIARSNQLNPSTLRVLLYIIAKVEYQNILYKRQIEIALELNMQPTTVSRAFHFLKTQGIIEKSMEVRGYILHEALAWKGTRKSRYRRRFIRDIYETSILESIDCKNNRKDSDEIEL